VEASELEERLEDKSGEAICSDKNWRDFDIKQSVYRYDAPKSSGRIWYREIKRHVRITY